MTDTDVWAVRYVLHTGGRDMSIPLDMLLDAPRDAFRGGKTYASHYGAHIYVLSFRPRKRQRASAFQAVYRSPTGGAERRGTLPELRRRQRALARARRGSKRRGKTKAGVVKLHAHVANQRRDEQHKIALDLIRRYGFITIEDLSIDTMDGPRWLNRAIRDAGWGQFLGILKYKAASAGTQVVAVDPRGTSQECSGCGTVVAKTLRDRKHACPVCGLVLHRDENAARNILARGLRARTVPEGLNVDVGLHAPRSCLL